MGERLKDVNDIKPRQGKPRTMRFGGPKCDTFLIKLVKWSAAGCARSSSSRAEAGRQVPREKIAAGGNK